MENNQEENQEETNLNANSAYSGSGSMQPGGGTGEAGRLNDYSDDEEQNETDQNKEVTPNRMKRVKV